MFSSSACTEQKNATSWLLCAAATPLNFLSGPMNDSTSGNGVNGFLVRGFAPLSFVRSLCVYPESQSVSLCDVCTI